ncbi:helix-turn-helix domain-containing protein [Streptosporangium sp. NPDC000239]|uniref:helix-turn-helix domain-containing protein n=1 Tax=Streptosporangium sp. NPDC000239 TaxID=3154248 RepID=UPI00332789C9
MARKPEVFVRALTMEEGRRLQRSTHSAKDPVKLRRAIVVLMSAQGQSASAIKALMQVSDDYVRQVVHTFNERGLMPWTQNGAGAVHGGSVSGCASASA